MRDIIYSVTLTNAPYCSDFVLTKDTPYLAPLRASYGVSFVSILAKNNRVMKGFYCTCACLEYILASSGIQVLISNNISVILIQTWLILVPIFIVINIVA